MKLLIKVRERQGIMRETAIERARLEDAHVVLGSATPFIEASFACRQGRFALFQLNNRYQGAVLPEVYAVDMREELKSGNRSILSRPLGCGHGGQA